VFQKTRTVSIRQRESFTQGSFGTPNSEGWCAAAMM
jgi:hypothetical protein